MSVDIDQSYPTWVPSRVGRPVSGSVAEILTDACRRFGERVALRCAGDSLTYAELDAYSERLAAYLRQGVGLAKGERAALLLFNVPAYPLAMMAGMRAGLIVVPVNPCASAGELKHMLCDSGAKLIVAADALIPVLDEVLPETSIESVLVVNSNAPTRPMAGVCDTACVSFNAALNFSGEPPPTRITPDDIAVLQYTSGTTGPAKAAVLSHGNILANQRQLLSWIAPILDDPTAGHPHWVVTALPLHHIFAWAVSWLAMARYGATNLLLPELQETSRLVEIFRRYPVSVFAGVNHLFAELLRASGFDCADFSGLRLVASAGTPLRQSVADQWQAVTGRCILEGYGLAETSPLLTLNSVVQPRYSGTVGFAMPSTDIVLLGEDGCPVEPGSPGELCVRGPQVMSRYWRRPEDDRETFTRDGYLRTGDIAKRHRNGSYEIVDRKQDTILVSGFTVYPSEVEAVSILLPGVGEAACVGVDDARTGQAVNLFIVRQAAELSTEAVRHHCRKHLTAYKVPKHVVFVEAVPKNSLGKVLRRQLLRWARPEVAA